MPEPHRSAFIALINAGAGAVDIIGETHAGSASAAFLARELARPKEHQRNICRYLTHLRPAAILDVGCGTGGLSVALCATFPNATLIGVDAVPVTVDAARLRAHGYGADATFERVAPDAPLPFPDEAFDLVTCTSVIEFITDRAQRQRFAAELKRVSRGHVLLTTPNPVPRLREQHTRRLLGDFRRRSDQPWAPTPWELDALMRPLRRRPGRQRVRDKLRVDFLPAAALNAFEWVMPWQFGIYEAPQTYPRMGA